MTTATKEKPIVRKSQKQTDPLQDSLTAFHEKWEAAERLGFGGKDTADLSLAESHLLSEIGLHETKDKNAFLRRCRRAAEFVEAAGSKAEFSQEKKTLAEAEARESAERPKLSQQIVELQSELTKLGQDSQRVRVCVERKTQARKSLLELAPQPFVEESAHLRAAANAQFVQEISWCQNRLRLTDEIQKRQPTERWSLDHAKSLDESHPCHLRCNIAEAAVPNGRQQVSYSNSINATAWQAYRAELQADRASVEQQLQTLSAQHDAAREAARQPLRYYHDKYNL